MPAHIPRQRTAVLAILLIGAVLRTIQYVAMTSMSSDEVAVALNVIDRGWVELLFRPLMHDQVAPLGFLFLQKLSVATIGDTEAAYRFFPYLLSLVSLVLFWRVAARYLAGTTLIGALIAFAWSPALTLYAGIGKQYTGDIVVSLLLLWIALRFLEGRLTRSGAVAAGIGGGMALLLSHPAVLVAAATGALLLVIGPRDGASVRRLVIIGIGWAVGAAIVTYVSLATLSPSTSAYMDAFWRADFPPAPWRGPAELLWIPIRLAKTVAYFVTYILNPHSLPVIALAGLYLLLLLPGTVQLVRADRRSAALLAAPVVVAIVAAAVRVLPLSGRVSLFIGPALLIAAFAGFDRLRVWLPGPLRGLVRAAPLAFALLPALGLLVEDPPPRVLNWTLPVIREVKAQSHPGDVRMVSRGRWTLVSVEYYGRRFDLEGWTHLERVGADTAEEVLRGYLRAMDAFRGAPRAWLYLEGTVPCEDEAMVGYLSTIGERLHGVRFGANPKNTMAAYLFDLSDPGRLSTTTADTYAVPVCRD